MILYELNCCCKTLNVLCVILDIKTLKLLKLYNTQVKIKLPYLIVIHTLTKLLYLFQHILWQV